MTLCPRSTRRLRNGVFSTCLAALALGAPTAAHGATNLLANGSFEDNNGFGSSFTTAFNSAGFQGWPGWASDFNDNGVRDFSYDPGTPGGFMFFNLFPAGPGEGNPTQPTLTGDASVVALGPSDGNTTSFAWQQVRVTPGDTMRVTVWSRVDSTALRGDGAPEPTIFDSTLNQAFHDVAYVDPLTGEEDLFLFAAAEQVIFDAAADTLSAVDRVWFESTYELLIPAGASLLRQTIGFNQFNLEPGAAFFDTASIVNLSDGFPVIGDLDYDGRVTALDVQMMTLGVAGELAPASIDRFDLSGNQVIDQADLDLLQALVTPIGDYNGDGAIDAADYTVYRDFFGSTTELAADGNGDGVVGQPDYDLWAANFGEVVPTASPVPAPAATAIALLGVAAFARRR